ncbi:CusA/CzcA family heavy metal efflux RND transporter [Sesbania bispinosa]|nr:CusA/CzcA family heavy metal efflux RND transporter [Sesbania bispinosa]
MVIISLKESLRKNKKLAKESKNLRDREGDADRLGWLEDGSHPNGFLEEQRARLHFLIGSKPEVHCALLKMIG